MQVACSQVNCCKMVILQWSIWICYYFQNCLLTEPYVWDFCVCWYTPLQPLFALQWRYRSLEVLPGLNFFDYNTKLYFESVCVGMSGLCCICVFCALKSPWRLSFWLGDLVWAGFDLAAADMPLLSTGRFKNTVCSNCSRGSKWQDLQCMILVCSENN